MRGALSLAAAVLAAFIGQSVAHPIVAHPGGKNDITYNADNVLNSTTADTAAYNPGTSTASGGSDGKVVIDVGESTETSSALPVTLVNNYGSGMYAYMSGSDSNGTPCFIDPSGNYFYPTASGAVPVEIDNSNIAIPLGAEGSSITWQMPGDLQSGRIYLSQGYLTFYAVDDANGVASIVEPSAANPDDPSAGVPWGFIEFNYVNNVIYTNISYVDFVGLSLGMALSDSSTTQVVEGLSAGAVQGICDDLQTQAASEGQPWDELCVTDGSGNALRVLSPNLYTSATPSWMSTYFDDYAAQVWSTYTSSALSIDTQESDGTVTCQVSGGTLTCGGDDNRGYEQPSTADIWGCNSGPFAIESGDTSVHYAVVPRLCAAFDRSTLLISGGNVQPSLPSSDYYTVNPTNHYSRIVHNYENDGIGYAFSYDDVAPDGGSAVSGEISTTNPTNLKVTVGSYS
ncbi:glycoside hydrolase family 64 protein [Xylariaceae sp. FL0255]|nr:glycoside hydrolase family 64 protein [Xylariaceae sp. FL0255]